MVFKIQKSITLVFALSSALVLTACGPGILSALNPYPKVNIDPREETISLKIDDSIQDAFIIPAGPKTREVHVNSWHQSLKSGFTNGFSNYFTIDDSNPSLTVKLVKTDISYGKTGTELGPIKATTTTSATTNTATTEVKQQSHDIFGATIIYQAQLIDASGNILAKDYSTATSKTSGVGLTGLALSAVETMYEQISLKFFPVE